jgi:hypothetical protein
MTETKTLANVGDFVKINSANLTVTLGVLLACVKLEDCEGENDICIIRELQPKINSEGEPLLTEFDCPILLLTNNLFHVLSVSIYSSVSFAHICFHTCCCSEDAFVHDLSNVFFCYNNYLYIVLIIMIK